MLRLFIAVTLEGDALGRCVEEATRVRRALGPLAPGVRFVRAEGLHLTLKFLGHVPDDQVVPLRDALAAAAREVAPFALALGGLEAFPSPRKPRVLCLAAREGAQEMVRLAAAVERHVAPLGFPTEDRPFTPHVTLARVKDFKAAPAIGQKLVALPAEPVARADVRDLALMRSELAAGGSLYSALHRLPLG